MGRSQRGVKGIVIQAARTIFAKYGFRKTTMDEIAQASHLAKSSIYHYFHSKEEIFAAIVEHEAFGLLEEIARDVDAEPSPIEKLRIFFRFRLQAMQKATTFYSAVLDQYFEFYPAIEKMRRTVDARELELIGKILRDGVASGVFVLDDIETALVSLRTILRGVEMYCIAVDKDFRKIEQVQELFLNNLFYGIVKR